MRYLRWAKGKENKYGTKADIQASLRNCIPTLSREVVDKLLSGFKEDKTMYTDFLVYFDVKEVKIKTDESKERTQKEWVKFYTDIWSKNKVDPMEIIKDADTNRNNKLELKELEAVVKFYIKSPAIDYKELQHIIDWFDTNNDGVCTVQEYKDAILKYGQKNGPL